MTACIPQLGFDFHSTRRIEVAMDAPDTSSDGGLLLVRQLDERRQVTDCLTSNITDKRDARRVEFSVQELVRQRVYQIAAGYEDQNDAQTMRRDPVLRTACDRSPSGEDWLGSQSTLSRLENGVSARDVNRMRAALEDEWVARLEPHRSVVVLDVDSTDDPTHGHQQLSMFHGFYDQHMYHPLLVIDATTGDIATVLLRPGNAHAAAGASNVLCRLIRKVRQRLPNAMVIVRGDSAFAMPQLLDRIEALCATMGHVYYIVGLAKNARVLELAKTLIDDAAVAWEAVGEPVRDFGEVRYGAKGWSRARRVIVKVEHNEKGANPRFVVTSFPVMSAQSVYDYGYCARGAAENFIKDFKNAIDGDRLSCQSFLANAFRTMLHLAAYRLLHGLRETARELGLADLGRAQLDTLRLKVLKVAALVTQSARRILIRLPQSFPMAVAFQRIARALHAPREPSTA